MSLQSEKEHGCIMRYNTQKGIGTITSFKDDKSYFFHISNLLYSFSIYPGLTEVSFVPSQNEKGLIATSISKLKSKIEGKFANLSLSNQKQYLSNEARMEYLREQKKTMYSLLQDVSSCGITPIRNNDWIDIDGSLWLSYPEPSFTEGHRVDDVPSGYHKTARYLLDLLRTELKKTNHDYLITAKGLIGEQKVLASLKAVSLDYPVLSNIRLEQLTTEDTMYSAESDIIVITDRVVFIVETKNYGGKGDVIRVESDGRWFLRDRHTGKETSLHNPHKQTADHEFAIRKFFKDNNIDAEIPMISLIAIANDDVEFEYSPDVSPDIFSRILRVDMIGTYILSYIKKEPIQLQTELMETIKETLNSANLPPRTYPVIDRCENVKIICEAIRTLYDYWQEDNTHSVSNNGYEEQEMQRLDPVKTIEKAKHSAAEIFSEYEESLWEVRQFMCDSVYGSSISKEDNKTQEYIILRNTLRKKADEIFDGAMCCDESEQLRYLRNAKLGICHGKCECEDIIGLFPQWEGNTGLALTVDGLYLVCEWYENNTRTPIAIQYKDIVRTHYHNEKFWGKQLVGLEIYTSDGKSYDISFGDNYFPNKKKLQEFLEYAIEQHKNVAQIK